jgi:cytidylate kinase
MGSYIEEFQKEDRTKESSVVITVDGPSGPSGAGKDTLAEYIASEIGLVHFSASDVFYSIAEERGISHVELANRADKQVDLEVDRRTLERGLENNCVIDSRIASWVLGDYSDLRIHVTADLEERAKRIAVREDQEL